MKNLSIPNFKNKQKLSRKKNYIKKFCHLKLRRFFSKYNKLQNTSKFHNMTSMMA